MAGYKEVAQLIREGKSASEITSALNIYPSRLGQILSRPRFKRLLQADLLLAEALAATLQLNGVMDAVSKLVTLTASDNEKVALQAALTVLHRVDKPMFGFKRHQPDFSQYPRPDFSPHPQPDFHAINPPKTSLNRENHTKNDN
jgi:hypothetical protein